MNQPTQLAKTLAKLEAIQKDFNSTSGGKKVTLAGLIVLGGNAAVEEAAKKAGHGVIIPCSPGRTDASQEQTDAHSFAVLEPKADGFRNYLRLGQHHPAEELLVDRAQLMTLTAPEMTILVGGMRVLNANYRQSKHGVLTKRPETLTNDFFVNLLDMGTKWQASSTEEGVYEGLDRATGEIKWTGTRVDLVFGSNSQLRAISEVYACSDSKEAFVKDFCGRLEQGDESGSLRSGVISIKAKERSTLGLDGQGWPLFPFSRTSRKSPVCDPDPLPSVAP